MVAAQRLQNSRRDDSWVDAVRVDEMIQSVPGRACRRVEWGSDEVRKNVSPESGACSISRREPCVEIASDDDGGESTIYV